ncbi:MoaD/ThiS family protein [Nocardioides lianchengensis]|uniref:MoaD/ThiS family protein n=1 Tax=Nocardioides lianchengensis TaxID=1045774 RepID=UPI001BA7FA7E|nr:MoaD/ThiS family protein [Nocardioides lianchengensis]
MTDTSGGVGSNETELIRVRYWAAAKAAAGVAQDELPVSGPVRLAELVRRVVDLHPGTTLGEVVRACSVLVDDRPVGSADPETLLVEPGSSVELLPPFAGG